MKCKNCGTEIADKALICYRCGEPTTAPRVQPPARTPARGPLPVAIAMIVIVVLAAFGMPYLPAGPARIAGWVVLVILVVLTALRLKPGRRRLKR
ncbi:MAG TPA: hypothetical protein VEK56_04515 [Vicinamibacterales bacterium]|nr:hypothetical protein [Vicinamibacterales bacterium]